MTLAQEALASPLHEALPARPDFADVYREHLTAVWQYVRSRVWNHHEAQDATSEVFVRAFRSWTRYEVARGEVAPWLFRIAQRTVVDWLRRRPRELSMPEEMMSLSAFGEDPEAELEHREDLARLGEVLQELTDRERDAIALRFAAELSFAEISEVLDLSPPAAKMMVWRAINRLRALFFRQEEPEVEPVPVAVGRAAAVTGGPTQPDARLAELLAALAVAHRFEVPPDLPGRIASCVGCTKQVQAGRGRRGWKGRRAGPKREAGSIGGDRLQENDAFAVQRVSSMHPRLWAIARRFGIVPFVGLGWGLIAPSCFVCIGGALPFVGFGLTSVVGLSAHSLGLVLAPLALIPLWLNYRRHGMPLAILLGMLGAAGILLHNLGHLRAWPATVGGYGLVWEYGLRIGVALVLAGTALNAVTMVIWVTRQRRGLADALAEGCPVPRRLRPSEPR